MIFTFKIISCVLEIKREKPVLEDPAEFYCLIEQLESIQDSERGSDSEIINVSI